MMRLILSSVVSCSSVTLCSESTMFIAAAVRPPWLEWASSIMIANFLFVCSEPISSRRKGKVCTVEIIIFFPCFKKPESCLVFDSLSPSLTAPIIDPTWANPFIVSLICLSSKRRSVITRIESKISAPFPLRPINWCANHAIEFDLPLPAECWIR